MEGTDSHGDELAPWRRGWPRAGPIATAHSGQACSSATSAQSPITPFPALFSVLCSFETSIVYSRSLRTYTVLEPAATTLPSAHGHNSGGKPSWPQPQPAALPGSRPASAVADCPGPREPLIVIGLRSTLPSFPASASPSSAPLCPLAPTSSLASDLLPRMPTAPRHSPCPP